MLVPIYPDEKVRNAVFEDPETAPIPEMHKALFRYMTRVITASWEVGDDDIRGLREVGLTDADIVHWTLIGPTQGYTTMNADAVGVDLEEFQEMAGRPIGSDREEYQDVEDSQLAPAIGQNVTAAECGEDSKVGQNLYCEKYLAAAFTAEKRYGFVPNFFKAISLEPDCFGRTAMAIELLERPQSDAVSTRQHAMVRALVSQITRSPYGQVTTKALLDMHGEPGLWEALSSYPKIELEAADKVILDFADKLARNSYKVTAKDAQKFRDAGLTDEAYVEVLNITAIQVCLDRTSNCLNIEPDEKPLLALWQMSTGK